MLRSFAALRTFAPCASSYSGGAIGSRAFGFGSEQSGNDPETLEKEKEKQVGGTALNYHQQATKYRFERDIMAC